MSDRRRVLWSPRARERIKGLEHEERAAAKRAAADFRDSGASPQEGPALSQDRALRWRLFGGTLRRPDDVVGVLEYRVYPAGEHDQFPDGGYFVTLVITEAGEVSRIRQHLEEAASGPG